MKLIVGLGNPDKQYENTFHNLGFMVADVVADKLGFSFSKEKCKALLAEGKMGGEKVIVAKPLTYMNLSGQSVRELLNFYKISLKDLLVIYDDYDLFKGTIRIRESGSSGTHNGMRNIVSEIGSSQFARIRLGFKPTEEMKIPLINFVLSGIKADDKPVFEKTISVASDAGVAFAKGVEIQKIMQQFNGSAN